jgi:hypothetical protein
MNVKNQWLILIISSITLFCFGSYGYLVYSKISKYNRLSGADIASFLIEMDDLPSGYSPGTIRNLLSDDYFRFVQGKEQEILAPDGSTIGSVRIYLVSLKGEQEEMYNFLSLMETPEGVISLEIDDIGEMQLGAIDPFGMIVFTRCTGIGYLQIDLAELRKGYATDLLIAHAKTLDKKLKTIACEQP